MKKQVLGLKIVLLGVMNPLISQNSVNDYKYVIVPTKYDFLKEDDKYQVNSLTAFLFNKYGFLTVMKNDNYPGDLIKNNCLALTANVIKHKGMFITKLQVELRNCKNELVFVSEIGESREKDYKIAFNLALRNAFKSIEALEYNYQENVKIRTLESGNSNTEEDKTEIAKLKAE
jgi:hypothetical protein